MLELLADEPPELRHVRLALLAAGAGEPQRILALTDADLETAFPQAEIETAAGGSSLGGEYDLIWCGDRWDEVLDGVDAALTPGGVVVFTTNGASPAGVCAALVRRAPDLQLLVYHEAAWAGTDVVACMRRA
jgi:hypothetical protein